METHSKYIAIGDVHGCPNQLEEILSACKDFPDHMKVFLGDYIDRGPDPEKVISILRGQDAVFLLGNHEVMLKSHLHDQSAENVQKIQKLYRLSPESQSWIFSLTRYILLEDLYVFVHAGLNKSKSLLEQSERDCVFGGTVGGYLDVTNKKVIHGHNVVVNPEIVENRININTGAGYGGSITALVLPEMIFLSSSKTPKHESGSLYIN